MSQSVTDNRDFSIYVHSELDDYPLSLEAFRVYCHLVRRAGANGKAWPSYKSIGEKCFRASYPRSTSDTLRRKAIDAIKELIEARLITKQERFDENGDSASNAYELLHRSEWKGLESSDNQRGSDGGILPSDGGTPPSVPPTPQVVMGEHYGSDGGTPKGIPVEVIPSESFPVGESLAAPKLTPQQEMFGAVCEAIGWDYRTLSKEDQAQVAQAVGILTKADYHVEDILLFMTSVWFKDWRWTKNGEHPTLKQLRQEIGKTRSLVKDAAPKPKETGMDGYRNMLKGIGIDL